MIFDKIGNKEVMSRYPEFKSAINFLTSLDINSQVGEYRLDDDGCFARVMVCTTLEKNSPDKVVESHSKFADVHAVLRGEEFLQLFNESDANSISDYDAERDVNFFKNDLRPCQSISMKPGDFAVFFPGEIHSPQIAPRGQSAKIKKVVIKVVMDN